MMKTSDNPLPFDLDEGEKILWTLHKPLPPGSMKLRILLWRVAVVLGILALVLLSSDFALAFVLGVVALLCVSGAEHNCTNAPHRISYEQSKETHGRKWTRRTVTTHHPLLAFLFFLVRYLRASRNKRPEYVLIKC